MRALASSSKPFSCSTWNTFLSGSGTAARKRLKSKMPLPSSVSCDLSGTTSLRWNVQYAIPIPREVRHRIAAADQHVAGVELEPDDRWIQTVHEDVVRDLSLDRLHVLGLVMKREPEPVSPRDRAGRIEVVRPLPPVVERPRRLIGEARHDQIFLPERLRDVETPAPIRQKWPAPPCAPKAPGDLPYRACRAPAWVFARNC